MDSDALFEAEIDRIAPELHAEFSQTLRAVPLYEVAVENDGLIYVSGQIPRVQGVVTITGPATESAAEDSLAAAQRAAAICALRALAILRQSAGSLNRIRKILRVTVYVHSDARFTRQSEVADAASQIFYTVLGPDGGHTRTSVGVAQLPKNATVELDLIAALTA